MVFPNQEEIELAAEILVNDYQVTAAMLNRLFNADQINPILKEFNGQRLAPIDIAKLLIYQRGADLFAGSSEEIRELRCYLLKKLPDKQIVELYSEHCPDRTARITQPSRMIRPLALKRWKSGGAWPRDFVDTLVFPEIFAGIKRRESLPDYQDIAPLTKPPKLVDFQIQLKERMRSVLESEGNRTRCVVTLPTGGGKTRVAVEAFIEWMQPRFSEGKYLIWIAQSEELCEQAIKCIEQTWGSSEFPKALRIYRYFGGRVIPQKSLCGGAVIASIQQLHTRIQKGDPSLDSVLKHTGAMIIDEAHRAVSSMYDGLLKRAIEIAGPELFPICGLTATPGRTGTAVHETIKLVDRFEANLIAPSLPEAYQQNPYRYFRDQGYLAKAFHIVYRSSREYQLTEEELEECQWNPDISPLFLKRLAADTERNLVIIKRLLQIPPKEPTLVYACTVEHAHLLSVIMNTSGRRSAAVSADTPASIRRGAIEGFKAGQFDFLFNYGVLTTGFDAPLTRNIVICRPTTSDVLYEQIIGRGLRGPKFGGTETCHIIDFADNISQLGQPLSFVRFIDFWNGETVEGNMGPGCDVSYNAG